jgi:hypothetical protein
MIPTSFVRAEPLVGDDVAIILMMGCEPEIEVYRGIGVD